MWKVVFIGVTFLQYPVTVNSNLKHWYFASRKDDHEEVLVSPSPLHILINTYDWWTFKQVIMKKWLEHVWQQAINFPQSAITRWTNEMHLAFITNFTIKHTGYMYCFDLELILWMLLSGCDKSWEFSSKGNRQKKKEK